MLGKTKPMRCQEAWGPTQCLSALGAVSIIAGLVDKLPPAPPGPRHCEHWELWGVLTLNSMPVTACGAGRGRQGAPRALAHEKRHLLAQRSPFAGASGSRHGSCWGFQDGRRTGFSSAP